MEITADEKLYDHLGIPKEELDEHLKKITEEVQGEIKKTEERKEIGLKVEF